MLHFLAPNRVGPVRATARVLGQRPDGDVLRVEVRDEGADRTTAVAIVTSAAPLDAAVVSGENHSQGEYEGRMRRYP